MLNFEYSSPTYYSFGEKKEEEVTSLLKKFLAKKILIVIGGSSVKKSGLLDRVKNNLEKDNIEYKVLEGIKANPESDKVYEGINIVKENNIDFILAIGGGSVIDASKAIAAGAVYDGDFWDFFRDENRLIVSSSLPVGVILTIAAAGSEGSPSMVITNTETKQKRGNTKTDIVRPVFAIMNPSLTMTLPSYQTACGIVDIMTHIFERYFSNTKDCYITDAMSEAILKTLMEMGKRVIENPNDYEARANIMWASTIAHNNILGMDKEQDWASHKIEHELSGKYDIAHGAGLAVIVPKWMRYVSKINPSKFHQFRKNVMKTETIDQAIDKLSSFWTSLGMPSKLSDVGFNPDDLEFLIRNVDYTKEGYVGNYVRLRREDIRNIYLDRVKTDN